MKRYIDMIVRYTEDGHIIPLAVRWSAGELFDSLFMSDERAGTVYLVGE